MEHKMNRFFYTIHQSAEALFLTLKMIYEINIYLASLVELGNFVS